MWEGEGGGEGGVERERECEGECLLQLALGDKYAHGVCPFVCLNVRCVSLFVCLLDGV